MVNIKIVYVTQILETQTPACWLTVSRCLGLFTGTQRLANFLALGCGGKRLNFFLSTIRVRVCRHLTADLMESL